MQKTDAITTEDENAAGILEPSEENNTMAYNCTSSETHKVSLEIKTDETPEPEPAGTPSLIGSPSTSQPKIIWYKKKSGVANAVGEDYEWKMLLLFFLRLLAAGYEFQLASNMEEAGLFDDIVVRYRTNPDDSWRVAYLQLKHKQNVKNIQKIELIGLKDLSLVKYSASYASLPSSSDNQSIILFTNAGICDDLVSVKETDQLLATGGKVVSFKLDGEVYLELCEWVDFKKTLTELHGQLDGKSSTEVGIKVNNGLRGIVYHNKVVQSWKEELIKNPTLGKLKDILKKLKLVSDKDSYRSFLAKFEVYSGQAHESELDVMITEELSKVWISNDSLQTSAMKTKLKEGMKAWWQREHFFLTQDSKLWLDIVKPQVEAMSKSTIDLLTKSGVKFLSSSLKVLFDKVNEVAGGVRIFNLRVDLRTSASSLKVHQALAMFGETASSVLHVNTKAFLEREDDEFLAWATRWCRVLVVECDAELDQEAAARIGARILDHVEMKTKNKVIVLIAPEKHKLNVQLYQTKNYVRFNDNFVWNDLTEESKQNILSNKMVINGVQSPATLSELLSQGFINEGFIHKTDLDVLSQLMSGDFSCGKQLDEGGKFFITRRLVESVDDVPFVVNSVSDVVGKPKVVLVVAEPGMGKSTLITHLAKSAKREDPTAWVLHIKLNDCAKYLKQIDVKLFDELAATQFLERYALCPGNCLEKLLFGTLEHKLIVLIDAVDEVCPHYELQVFTLLGFLKDMDLCQLWVASRPVFQEKLENTLGVRALHLVAFSAKDQKEFFNQVWIGKYPLAIPDKCKEVTESLLTWLTDSLGKDNPILGVPLMNAIIAETFQEQMFSEDAVNGKLKKNGRLDVLFLFNTFVTKKFDLYCVEKKKSQCRELAANRDDEDTLLKRALSNHCLAALRVLFSRKQISCLEFEGKETFDEDLATYLKEVSDGREKMGMIDNVNDGKPHFVHRSFAEFFAASWLSLNFKNNQMFIEQIIFDPAFKLLSEMFHRALAENHPHHIAVLNRDLKATKSFFSTESNPSVAGKLDAGGRTLLDLAVLLSSTDRDPDAIRIVKFLVGKRHAGLNVQDKVLSWVPFRYAEWSGAWSALDIMLQRTENFGVCTSHIHNGWPEPIPSVMLDAAKFGSQRVVRYLIKDRRGKLNSRGPLGESMIHKAAEGGNIEVLKYLSTKRLPIDVKDYGGNTALRYTSPQAVSYLLKAGLKLEAVNKQSLTPLHAAARQGAYPVMATLIDKSASYNVDPANIVTAKINACLLCAAYAGNIEYVKNLVAMGASVHHRDKNGHTAAWVAMNQKHFAIMDWLLLYGTTHVEDTTLHGACRKQELEIVSFLLSRDRNIEVKGWHGQTPLIAATQEGHLSVVKLLLEKGASVKCLDKDGCSPLHSASSRGDEKIVVLLLRRGVHINATNNKGRTPLHAATLDNQLGVVELLLKQGANVECPDEDGSTPLHAASLQGYLDIAALLLRFHMDVDSRSNLGRTALMNAVSENKWEVVELLLEKGANIEIRDKHGWSLLHTASSKGFDKVVTLLLKRGADFQVENENGQTPLDVAIECDQFQVVKLLVEKKYNLTGRCLDSYTKLHTASLVGNEHTVAMFLRRGADVNATTTNGWTPLHVATLNNHVGVVKLLLEQGASPECRDENGKTPLYTAASQGFEKIAALLLGHGADANATDEKGRTVLEAGIKGGHSEVVKLLLTQGASVLCRYEDDTTPLHAAAMLGDENLVALLLSHDADVTARTKTRKEKWKTPLDVAIENDRLEVVKLLLENESRTRCHHSDGWTPLNRASSEGNEKAVALLLSYCDDVNAENKQGQTPLITASRENHLGVVKLLLNNGALVRWRDKHGWTALHWASLLGWRVVALLLSHGADINAASSKGVTPLLAATTANNRKVTKLLLTKGASVDYRDQDGWTPLHDASLRGNEQVLDLLLRYGADVNARDDKGCTPIHAATWSNKPEVVKKLLENGASVKQCDADGWTPLHYGCLQGHEEVVSLLIRNGAEANARNTCGDTPLHTATWRNQSGVVKLLLEKGISVHCRDAIGWTPLHTASAEGSAQLINLLLGYGADVHVTDHKGRTPLNVATRSVAKLLKSVGGRNCV